MEDFSLESLRAGGLRSGWGLEGARQVAMGAGAGVGERDECGLCLGCGFANLPVSIY